MGTCAQDRSIRVLGRMSMPLTGAVPDGVLIAVHDLGGTGPDALVGHATGFPLRTYGALLAELTAELRCGGPDFRGNGGSSWPANGRADWTGLAADLETAREVLRMERPIGIGHSSGATALLLLEASRPGTFRALYCYEPAVLPPGEAGQRIASERAAGARRRRSSFASRAEARERYQSSPLASLGDEALDAYLEHAFEERPDRSVGLRFLPEWEARIYEAAPAASAALEPARVRCAVHLVAGSESKQEGEGARRLAGVLPAASFEEIAGLSHLGPLQAPQKVASSVLAWQRALPDAGANQAPGATIRAGEATPA
ncbi:MAG: alpha/beta hydrolase fold protein [Acidimicrobiaceae bacterium]|nr:alpha/beta hydrolase fold protein [Acidimicrobiaceae bacterium]